MCRYICHKLHILLQGQLGASHLASGLWGGSLQCTVSSGCFCCWHLEVVEDNEGKAKVSCLFYNQLLTGTFLLGKDTDS